MIWLTVSAMLHDLVDGMYVLCCKIYLTVSAMLDDKLTVCTCYVT